MHDITNIKKTNNPIAFVITKPLQLIVSLSILDEIKDESVVDLIITNDFFDSESYFKKIKSHLRTKQYANFYFFDNQIIAYDYISKIKYKKIFIDSDVGFKRWMQLLIIRIKNHRTEINVYEEGIGSYRNDLYKNNFFIDRIKFNIFNYIGIGVWFGCSKFTNSIYLYAPQNHPRYKNIKTVKINNSIANVIKSHSELSDKIFTIDNELIETFKTNKESIAMYFSDWKINDEAINDILKKHKKIIIKPHPHIKVSLAEKTNVVWAKNSIPAEILLIEAMKYCSQIIVYHHGTSTENYLKKSNIEFIRIE